MNPDHHDHQITRSDPDRIHGDILESILAHVSLIDLVPACLVSRSWHLAVTSSLSLSLSPIKPWLLFHTHNLLSSASSTAAFDPRTRSWLRLHHHQRPNPITGCSNLQFSITPSKLSFSTDPLRLRWRHIAPPPTWRIDPLIAFVGDAIVVAGGGSEYVDDPLAVEVYYPDSGDYSDSGRWEAVQSMPVVLKDSAAPTWLAVAATGDKMLVTEKATGLTYVFSPVTKCWTGPHNIGPVHHFFSYCTIASYGSQAVFAALIGQANELKKLKLWRVAIDGDDIRLIEPPIGEVPMELTEEVIGSISVMICDGFVFVYNAEEPETVVYGEIGGGGVVDGWESVRNVVWKEKKIMERVVVGVGKVGFGDLQRAVWQGQLAFEEML
ncbi:hypothetical protein Droror1_Dr00018618 [Drosera rotundifolia]